MMYFTFYNVVYIVKFYNLDAHDVLLLFTLLNGLRFWLLCLQNDISVYYNRETGTDQDGGCKSSS